MSCRVTPRKQKQICKKMFQACHRLKRKLGTAQEPNYRKWFRGVCSIVQWSISWPLGMAIRGWLGNLGGMSKSHCIGNRRGQGQDVCSVAGCVHLAFPTEPLGFYFLVTNPTIPNSSNTHTHLRRERESPEGEEALLV